MPDFTPKIVHEIDPYLYYAGMMHVFNYVKGAEKESRTPDEEKELECNRGASFFFGVSSFLRVFGHLPKEKEEHEALDKFLIELGVVSRWRPFGRASSQGEAGQPPSGPSGA